MFYNILMNKPKLVRAALLFLSCTLLGCASTSKSDSEPIALLFKKDTALSKRLPDFKKCEELVNSGKYKLPFDPPKADGFGISPLTGKIIAGSDARLHVVNSTKHCMLDNGYISVRTTTAENRKIEALEVNEQITTINRIIDERTFL